MKLDDAAMRDLRQIAQRFDLERSLYRVSDDELCERLGWMLYNDHLRVCGTQPVARIDGDLTPLVRDSNPATRPVVRRAEAPPPPAPVEDETFAAQVDTSAMVRDLIEAAKLGLAFCEECEREKPAKSTGPAPVTTAPPEFPPTLDADAAVRALIEAAKAGVPFCEECEKQASAAKATQ